MDISSIQDKIDWTNKVFIGSLILAAVSAVVVAVTSWLIIGWQDQVSDLKDAELEKYKEGAKVQISEANAEAAAANSSAANANERAKALEARASEQQVLVEKAHADAARSLEQAKNAEAHLAEANARAEQARAESAKAYALSDSARADAAQSLERASEAEKNLAEANARAEQAKASSAQAQAEAALANEKTKELEIKALQARTDFEKERTARLLLEEKMKPRSISAEQRARLLSLLQASPKGRVMVVPKTFDEEAEAFAAQISSILGDAGFTIVPHTGPRPFSFGVVGSFICVMDMKNLPAHAAPIQAAFKDVGVDLPGYGNPQMVSDQQLMLIGVGPKP